MIVRVCVPGPCSPNPCLNDGQCEVVSEKRRGDVFSHYYCVCPPEVTGEHCETNINECQVKPCQNGGTCSDLNGDFYCTCPSPYVGKSCQQRCTSRLGLEAGGISEAHIRASSVRYTFMGLQRWGPELARLNLKGLVNAWSPAPHDREPWIQVWFSGAGRLGYSEFVKLLKFHQNRSVVCRRGCTLRLELIGCELNGCSEPMGLRSRLISDSQISTNAWTAAGTDQNQWIQVDLGASKKLTGIITQGAKDFGHIQFVTAFKVSYSQNGRDWSLVKDQRGQDKIFAGNTDNNVHKKNRFEPALFCRFIRVLPWDWHGRITLRLELLGCSQ
ncbi:hypothetical protein WMY93_031595 [Mugilogobius chulae]|uniref:Uncharacterized protein n=1 Tax=Mugilogobius chulae TaxID=88201 RepID=A0AAW0MHK7_9GOBI